MYSDVQCVQCVPGVVLGQVTQQLALSLGRKADLEEVQLAAADGVIPVHHGLGVIVIHEYVPEQEFTVKVHDQALRTGFIHLVEPSFK